MIRSSRIPPLLDSICEGKGGSGSGILSSYLITKDGELLGCSTCAHNSRKNQNRNRTICTNLNPQDGTTTAPLLDGHVSSESELPEIPSSSWEHMDPSDIGALVAEVFDDYKRLGSELSLLNLNFNNGAATKTKSGSAAVSGVKGDDTGAGTTGTDMSVKKSEGGSNPAAATGNSSSSGSAGRSAKDRGRLNCLIVELEKGLIGIATATSNTYVVALADSNAQHGLLKMKLTALAGYVRESFLPLGE